jgi:hypothetical protein
MLFGRISIDPQVCHGHGVCQGDADTPNPSIAQRTVRGTGQNAIRAALRRWSSFIGACAAPCADFLPGIYEALLPLRTPKTLLLPEKGR